MNREPTPIKRALLHQLALGDERAHLYPSLVAQYHGHDRGSGLYFVIARCELYAEAQHVPVDELRPESGD